MQAPLPQASPHRFRPWSVPWTGSLLVLLGVAPAALLSRTLSVGQTGLLACGTLLGLGCVLLARQAAAAGRRQVTALWLVHGLALAFVGVALVFSGVGWALLLGGTLPAVLAALFLRRARLAWLALALAFAVLFASLDLAPPLPRVPLPAAAAGYFLTLALLFCWAAFGQLRGVHRPFHTIRARTARYFSLVGRLEQSLAELKLTEAALRQQRDFAQAVVDTTQAMVLELDAQGRVLRFNRYAQQQTGYSEEEMLGRDWFETCALPQQRTSTRDGFQQITERTSTQERIHPILTKDGHELTVRWHDSPLRMADGEVASVLSVGHDITRILQQEEELQQGHRLQALGQLAGGIAHNFNNLLTAILGNAEMLRLKQADRGAADEGAAQHVDEILRACNRAAELTAQIGAFARTGKSQMVPVDVHRLISEVARVAAQLFDRHIEIRQQLAASPCTTLGDPTQLRTALLNLAFNARDAMPGGGTLTFATVGVVLDPEQAHEQKLTPGSYLLIAVRDTGVGMDEATQAHIFEPFFTTKGLVRATGLGLASVYGIVQSHHGTVQVRSKKGQGTEMSILLPLVAGEERQVGTRSYPALESLSKGHILVVDDEEAILALAEKILRRLGYEVTTCSGGTQALEFFAAHHGRIQLVILDLVMPKMDGQELYGKLKEIDPRVKALLATGFDLADTTAHLLEAGLLGVMAKPFHLEVMARVVAEALGPKRSATPRQAG